jgi:hypothetical protein
MGDYRRDPAQQARQERYSSTIVTDQMNMEDVWLEIRENANETPGRVELPDKTARSKVDADVTHLGAIKTLRQRAQAIHLREDHDRLKATRGEGTTKKHDVFFHATKHKAIGRDYCAVAT